MVQDNLVSSIKCMQWNEQDNIIPREELQIAENWGLNKPMFEALCYRDKLCTPSSPASWLAPPPDVFKLNFDGVSHDNPGQAGFGGLC